MMKKVYHKPSTTVLSYVMLKDVCNIATGSDGTDVDLAKKNLITEWEDEDESEAPVVNVWAD